MMFMHYDRMVSHVARTLAMRSLHQQGYSYRQIGQVFGVSHMTVKRAVTFDVTAPFVVQSQQEVDA
jgi:IS30 family transposase